MKGAAAIAGLVTLTAFALAACATADVPREDGFARAAHRCMAVNPGFTDAWGCIRKRITLEDVGAEDPDRARLKDLGDGLTAQLAGETLTSLEARSRLAAALPRSF